MGSEDQDLIPGPEQDECLPVHHAPTRIGEGAVGSRKRAVGLQSLNSQARSVALCDVALDRCQSISAGWRCCMASSIAFSRASHREISSEVPVSQVTTPSGGQWHRTMLGATNQIEAGQVAHATPSPGLPVAGRRLGGRRSKVGLISQANGSTYPSGRESSSDEGKGGAVGVGGVERRRAPFAGPDLNGLSGAHSGSTGGSSADAVGSSASSRSSSLAITSLLLHNHTRHPQPFGLWVVEPEARVDLGGDVGDPRAKRDIALHVQLRPMTLLGQLQRHRDRVVAGAALQVKTLAIIAHAMAADLIGHHTAPADVP